MTALATTPEIQRPSVYGWDAPIVIRRPAKLPPLPTVASLPPTVATMPPAAAHASVITLGDQLDSTWLTLGEGATAACVICDGSMHSVGDFGAGVVGKCASCGTELMAA